MNDELRPDLVEAAGGVANVPRYLQMEAEQIAEEFEFAKDCGYPFAAHMHPTESGKGKTWACPAAAAERIADDNGDEIEHGQPDFPGQFPDAPEPLVSRLTRWIGQSGWVRDYEHARAEAEAFVRDFPAEFAWLAERGQSMKQVPTVWWTGDGWTNDANWAMRFPTRETAEAYIEARSPIPSHRDRWAVAVEHGFLYWDRP